MAVNDEDKFPVQRRNIIVFSLTIIIFYLGEGKFKDTANFGFLPFELRKPEVLQILVVIMFMYFLYRFWVCGGNKIRMDFNQLKKDVFTRHAGWKAHLHNYIIENSNHKDVDKATAGFRKTSFSDSNPSLYKYTLTSNTGNAMGGYRLKIFNHLSIFLPGFWWALRNDPRISEYFIPYGLIIWVIYLLVPDIVVWLVNYFS